MPLLIFCRNEITVPVDYCSALVDIASHFPKKLCLKDMRILLCKYLVLLVIFSFRYFIAMEKYPLVLIF